jgi:hypothetical protein
MIEKRMLLTMLYNSSNCEGAEFDGRRENRLRGAAKGQHSGAL